MGPMGRMGPWHENWVESLVKSVPKNDLFPIFKTHQSIIGEIHGNYSYLGHFGTFWIVFFSILRGMGLASKMARCFLLRKSPLYGRSPRIDRILGLGNPSENQVELWNVSCFSLPQGLLLYWKIHRDSQFGYLGLSENSVPLKPMVNDHYPY